MEHQHCNDWVSAWGWVLWFAMIILIFSIFGNWAYTYRVHRLYRGGAHKTAIDFLNDRADDDLLARLITFPNVLITSLLAFLPREALKNIADTTIESFTCVEMDGDLSKVLVSI